MTEEQQALTPVQIASRLQAIDDRLDRGADKMDQQAAAIKALRAELERNSATTREVRELLDLARNGLKVLGWLGSATKWAGVLATAGLAIYSFFYAITHGGHMPPKP